MRNREVAVYLDIDGLRYRLMDLEEKTTLSRSTIVARAKKGLSLDAVLDPKHLFSREGLALGGLASGAKKQALTHCKWGHEFDTANTMVTPRGWRRCRTCHNAKMRARNAADRASRG